MKRPPSRSPQAPRWFLWWREAPRIQRWWWASPILWWATTSLSLAVLQQLGNPFARVSETDPAAADTLHVAFLQLYRVTLSLACIETAVALAIVVFLWRLKRRGVPVVGRRLLSLIFMACALAGVLLAQGAWRCHPPAPPYPEAAMIGIRFYLSIQQQLMTWLATMWALMGASLWLAAAADVFRAVLRAAWMRRQARAKR